MPPAQGRDPRCTVWRLRLYAARLLRIQCVMATAAAAAATVGRITTPSLAGLSPGSTTRAAAGQIPRAGTFGPLLGCPGPPGLQPALVGVRLGGEGGGRSVASAPRGHAGRGAVRAPRARLGRADCPQSHSGPAAGPRRSPEPARAGG